MNKWFHLYAVKLEGWHDTTITLKHNNECTKVTYYYNSITKSLMIIHNIKIYSK